MGKLIAKIAVLTVVLGAIVALIIVLLKNKEKVTAKVADVKAKMVALLDLIPVTGSLVLDTDDDLNRTAPALNDKICPDCLKTAVFDNGTFVEIGSTYVPEVICGIGRIGGIATGAVIFAGEEKGVALTPAVIDKINNFVTPSFAFS